MSPRFVEHCSSWIRWGVIERDHAAGEESYRAKPESKNENCSLREVSFVDHKKFSLGRKFSLGSLGCESKMHRMEGRQGNVSAPVNCEDTEWR